MAVQVCGRKQALAERPDGHKFQRHTHNHHPGVTLMRSTSYLNTARKVESVFKKPNRKDHCFPLAICQVERL